jgi:hypothetical protein
VELLSHCWDILTIVFGDNQGAISLAKTPQFHSRTKHIAIQHHFVREKQTEGKVDLQYIPTEQQVADGLTKALPKNRFVKFRDALGLKHRAYTQRMSLVYLKALVPFSLVFPVRF